MDGSCTRALVEFVSASAFRELSRFVVEHTRPLVLDTLGVGIYGASLPRSERLAV